MNQDELKELMRRHGFAQTRQLTIGSAIALCESPIYNADPPEADPYAVGDVALEDATWGPSIGLWMIRSLKADWGTGRPRDGKLLPDPEFNAATMRIIKTESNWWPWTTFRSGAWRAYAPDEPEGQPPPGMYFVVAGDSLSKIGARFGIDWHELARINGLHDPYLIRIGDLLLLPPTLAGDVPL